MLFDVSGRAKALRGDDFVAFEKDWSEVVAEVRRDQMRRVACEILMLYCPEDRDLGTRLLHRIQESGGNSVAHDDEQPRTTEHRD